jgi:hypothetical protein
MTHTIMHSTYYAISLFREYLHFQTKSLGLELYFSSRALASMHEAMGLLHKLLFMQNNNLKNFKAYYCWVGRVAQVVGFPV